MNKMDLTDKSQLLEYLKENNLWAKKGLSQNFLIDKNALGKIVESAELKSDDFIIEIGPGLGTLTEELLEQANEVVAVEMDTKLAELLEHSRKSASQSVSKSKLKIINADILKLNLDEVIGDKPYKVVANIPYHITSKILELFLSRKQKPTLIVLLVQKEVAERVCAKAGQMSTLAISVQLFGEPEIVDVVPKESFFPSPKVDSAILKIRIRNNESSVMNTEEERDFFRLVHIGFSAKRKTLINNLSAGYHISKDEASDIIKKVGLSEKIRAQELNISDWKNLTNLISKVGENG